MFIHSTRYAYPLFILFTAGCSSTSSSTSDQQSAFAANYCAADTEHAKACGSTTTAEKEAECRNTTGRCYGALLRPDAYDPLITCTKNRCGKGADGGLTTRSDDSCFREVGDALAATQARTDYTKVCLAKVSECDAQATTKVSNDWCTDGDIPWKLFTDSALNAFKPCFEKACGEMGACLKSTTATLEGGVCNSN